MIETIFDLFILALAIVHERWGCIASLLFVIVVVFIGAAVFFVYVVGAI